MAGFQRPCSSEDPLPFTAVGSRLLAETQADLLAAAQATEGRTNAWTRKPAFIEARRHVLALPPPPAVPAPARRHAPPATTERCPGSRSTKRR